MRNSAEEYSLVEPQLISQIIPLVRYVVCCFHKAQIVSDSEKPLVCIHKVFDLGESGGENETEGMQLASQSEIGYSCEKQQTYRILFDKPVMLMAGHWYVAYASVSSPSGSSSDAGSSGQNEIQGQDK